VSAERHQESGIVIGAGPGIGAAVARKLSREGLAVGVIARSRATVESNLSDLTGGERSLGLTADVTDEASLRCALDELVERLGVPKVLVYNAALIQSDPVGELSAQEQLDAYAVNVVGAITAISHLAPRMAEAGGGTVLLTGGMPDPIPEVTSLSLGKAGIRALTVILDKAYGPAGVHVATVTVAGAVAPGGAFDPDEIAERYWQLHLQPRDAWEREVLFTGSA
jgi:NAD(P)-dependent dehydrogenase (short-subunit alcohol dehydrogenase family)